MANNNFKAIWKEDIDRIGDEQVEGINQSIWGNLGIYRLVGDLMDIYLSKTVDIFLLSAMTGPSSQVPDNDTTADDTDV